MIDERRKKLAALSFGEKLELLEKLRQRSLMLAEAREHLAKGNKKPPALKGQKRNPAELDDLTH